METNGKFISNLRFTVHCKFSLGCDNCPITPGVSNPGVENQQCSATGGELGTLHARLAHRFGSVNTGVPLLIVQLQHTAVGGRTHLQS